MTSDTVPPPQSAVYRTVATCGTVVLAVAVLVFVWIMVTWPHPPHAGTTTKAQARASMQRDAQNYANALAAAADKAPLTDASLRAHPVPHGPAIGPPTVTHRADTTLVTFSTHASYGPRTARTPITACYEATLSPKTSPRASVTQISASHCAKR
ncbi:hypothetical protein [Streptomyces sp. NBC_01236]|uniref:hypothetical protein n=1 Tax=Streptomyces sp. NBC_01236 TaxID=2903789 RepID=UPI002E0D521E|nr:hypothetical protein OG324_15460 [Streptomyces sp. NBC_01236]